MATDATGSPTSLGIPKFNTSVDAPSGLGTNAMMDSIDALIAARITKPASPAEGDYLRYLSGAWVADTVAAPSGAPAGSVVAYAGSTAPDGWLLADGSAVSRTGDNADLFAAIGTTYGAGDGSTTFNLPDLRGRTPVGLGLHADVNTLGNNDGTSISNRRPKHKHTVGGNAPGADSATFSFSGSNVGQVSGGAVTVGPQTGAEPTDTPAYLVLNFIIKQ